MSSHGKMRKCCGTERGINKPHKTWCPQIEMAADNPSEPDWSKKCSNCGESPIVPITGLCGPCTFGEADTIGGNW